MPTKDLDEDAITRAVQASVTTTTYQPHAKEKLLAALASWVNGSSIRGSAEAAGIPYSTLKYHIDQNADSLVPDREARAEQALDLAFAYNQEAGRQAMEKLLRGETHDPRIDYGISKDAIARLSPTVTEKSKDVMGELIAKLGNTGGSVQVTVSTETPAIDVTPLQEDD